jgi:hypothetical protein
MSCSVFWASSSSVQDLRLILVLVEEYFAIAWHAIDTVIGCNLLFGFLEIIRSKNI